MIDNASYLSGVAPVLIASEPVTDQHALAELNPVSTERFCDLKINDVSVAFGVDFRPYFNRIGVWNSGWDEEDVKIRLLRSYIVVSGRDLDTD